MWKVLKTKYHLKSVKHFTNTLYIRNFNAIEILMWIYTLSWLQLLKVKYCFLLSFVRQHCKTKIVVTVVTLQKSKKRKQKNKFRLKKQKNIFFNLTLHDNNLVFNFFTKFNCYLKIKFLHVIHPVLFSCLGNVFNHIFLFSNCALLTHYSLSNRSHDLGKWISMKLVIINLTDACGIYII